MEIFDVVTPKAKIMGSKVVVTYKRKRLFSRSDHSHINFHSDTLCENAKSKTSNFHKQEGLNTECTLQINDVGFGSHVQSKDDSREDLQQCENHDSRCCDQCLEKHARKPEALHSVCSEQKDSSVSVESQKFTPEKKCSRESDAEKTICHPDTLLNGSPEVRYKAESSSQSNAVKSGPEREDSCNEILTVSQPHAACSGAEPEPICLKTSSAINGSSQTKGKYTSEASTFEETCKFNADQYSSLCNNSGVKRTLTSSLITFCRRSKRNRADNAVVSAKLSASSCLVDLTNEKEIPTENDNLCGGSDNHRINMTTQRLSDEDVKNRNMHSDVTERVDSALSLDLSVPPRASHNIDCNVPLVGGSDENQPVEISEVLHDSLASTREMEEDMSSLPLQHIENDSPVMASTSRDKGKCVSDSPPFLSCNSSKNNYIQFFPERRGEGMLQVANNSEKVSPAHQSNLQSSNLIGLSLRPEQIAQSREYHLSTPDRAQSYARDKMMLESILSRARAARGSRSSFLDKFEFPTTWLDEELDSLWIGVRRHGRGNWDAILGDRGLHFLPWKTPWDLSERWQVEQSRLLSSMPLSQRKYAGSPDLDDVRLSLGHSHQVEKRFLSHRVGEKTRRDMPEGRGFFIAEESSSSTGGLVKGCLPQWLRAAAKIPLGPASMAPVWHNHPSQQPWLNSQFVSTERRPEPEDGGSGPCSGSALLVERGRTGLDEEPVSKQEDLIIIPSDASSEETISDNHSGKP